MRILITTDTVGGVWNFATTLSMSLCSDHQVTLVSFGPPPSAIQRRSMEEMAHAHEGCFRFIPGEAPLEWMTDNDRALEGAELLARIAADFSADLLHANQFCWGALPRTGALDIPRIITAHSDVLSWAGACKPDGLRPSAWLERYRHLVQQGLDGADTIVAPTQWMLDALRSNFEVPETDPRTTQVIANGVDLDSPEQQKDFQNARRRQIITAGRFWDEAKNLKLLQLVDSPFRILCAGETSATSAAEGYGRANIHALGVLAPSDLREHFRESEIYLCPSLYEPFGLAPLEAAARGCALVLHDIPSLREVWGDAALYFTSRSALEALLAYLWENPQAVREASGRSIEHAAKYSLTRTSRSYTELYTQLVSVHSEGGHLSRA